MDLDFLLRAVQVAKIVYVPEAWGNFRYGAGGKTYDDRERMFSRVESVRRRYFKRSGWKTRLRALTLRCWRKSVKRVTRFRE